VFPFNNPAFTNLEFRFGLSQSRCLRISNN
jgi:hypothetical protein